jgi:hypothetical protein
MSPWANATSISSRIRIAGTTESDEITTMVPNIAVSPRR